MRTPPPSGPDRRFMPLVALGGALVVVGAAMAFLSEDPLEALKYLAAGPVLSQLALGDLLESTARLVTAGLAAAVAFRAGSFNLGGEGQAFTGGLAAAALALMFPGLPPLIAVAAAVLAGALAGAAIGALSGALRALWGVDELISSFLIAAAISPVGHVLLGGWLKDPESYLIAAPPLPAAYTLPRWWPPSRLGPAVIWAAAAVIGAVLFLGYTRRGYEWRLRGANEEFARYGGIRTGMIALWSMALSGALYGVAGATALLDGGQAVQGFTSGLGWDGLAVALIAGSRPAMVVPAALAYTWIIHGTRSAMIHTGFPYLLSGLVQATVFLLVTASLIRRKVRSR